MLLLVACHQKDYTAAMKIYAIDCQDEEVVDQDIKMRRRFYIIYGGN